MKIFCKLIILLLLTGFIYNGDLSGQVWKDLKNKAKNVKTGKKTDKNQTNTTNTNQNNNNVEQNNTKPTNTLEALVLDPNKSVFVDYETLFKKMTLDPKTGELKIEKVEFINLPAANFGTKDNEHKLTGVLKLNENVIQEFPFYGTGGVDNWAALDQRTTDYQKASCTIKDGGKYTLEFLIDGKAAEKVDFSIIQSVNKNNASGFFINDPMEKMGMISAQNISYGEPDPNSSLIFKFYEAILDVDKAFVDATPISVSLMKENPGGLDTYLGGYIDQELRHNSSWKLTDGIFFTIPGERYKYVTYKDVLDNDDKYYVDLFYNNDVYRYNFEVKNKSFISSLSDRSKKGVCWMEREYFGVPKYENFKPTKSIAGLKDNVSISIGKADGGSIGKGANGPVLFTDGQKINYSIYFNDEKIKNKYMNRLTEFVLTLKEGDKILAQSIDLNIFQGSPKFPSLIYNPDKSVMIAKEAFTYVFMEALSKLSAGNHTLKLVWELAAGNDDDVVGVRTITYKAVSGNPKFTKWAEDTKAQKLMSRKELGELMFLRSPSNDWVMYENNCGRVVWLRQDEYKEFYLYPGNKGRFDRAAGTLEQWNFGTLKWKTVQDFKAYKTIYKLSANEIAMLFLKQVPKEAIDKLKAIVDVEFASQDAFLAKVKSLIGEELTKKHEDLIVQSASIDFVKICN